MSSDSNTMRKVVTGALSGFVATLPMTVTMLAINKLLSRPQRQRLEPRKITDDMLHRAGLRDELSEQERKQAAIAAHFSFGAAAGTIYPFVEPYIPAPRGLRGPLYGLAVWAVNYAGVLPAIDTLPPPEKRPLGRHVLLIASHLVWGAAVQLSSDFARANQGSRK